MSAAGDTGQSREHAKSPIKVGLLLWHIRCPLTPFGGRHMRRIGFASFAFVFAALSIALLSAQQPGSATCDPAAIDADSYALTTEAQALNVLRPREPWWERFGIAGPRELGDVNEGSILLAERARELDPRNLLAYGYLARQYVVNAVDASKAEDAWRTVLDNGGAIVWTATLDRIDPRG